jgi:hypothetical protein
MNLLRRIFGGNRRGHDGKGDPSPRVAEESGVSVGAESTSNLYLLLSRRFSEPMDSVPGFRELYYCTHCCDYFVLAWHLHSSSLVEECDVVDDMPLSLLHGRDPADEPVFCPKCKTDYGLYGTIQHPEAILGELPEVQVYEAHDYPFPPDVPSTGTVRMGGIVAEKLVLLVMGEFPDGMNVRDFAYAAVDEVVHANLGGELCVSEAGGIRVHLLRVNLILDETDWLMLVLRKEVYRTSSLGTKVFLTRSLVNLPSPLSSALLCAVLSAD